MIEGKRKDAGRPRVAVSRPPKRISIYLAGHGVEAKISKKIDDDLILKLKAQPDATEKDVLMDWITDYLGLKS